MVTVAAAGFVALIIGLVQVVGLAGLGSAFVAKYLCSQVFLAGRAAAEVAASDLPAFRSAILDRVRWRVDSGPPRVSAAILGLGRREAVYRVGLGCTLSLAGPPAPVPAPPQLAPVPEMPRAPTPAALHQVVQAAFTEPDPTRLRRTRAVLVLQDGRVIAEHYAPGYGPHTRFPGWSLSKGVLNALLGILVGQGRLALDAPAPVPEWADPADARHAITLRQLLQMSSGLAFDEDYDDPRADVIRMLYASRDMAAYAAAKPLAAAPGRHYSYASGSSAILARILAAAAPKPWPRFAQETLFAPLGMTSAVIEPDSAGYPGLSSYVWASARDWARLGLLYLNDGVWAGRRILPAGWVAFSRTPAPADPRREYGAHFWLRVPAPDRQGVGRPHLVPVHSFHAAGHGAQYVSIIPTHRLVVVRLGLALDPGSWDHEAFLHDVVAALATP